MPAAGSNPLVSRPPTGTQPRPRTSASRPEARSRPDTSSSQQRAPDESALRLSQALGKAADQASRAALVSASLTMFPFPPSRKYNLAQIACALRARSCNACKPPPRARWVAVVVDGGGGWVRAVHQAGMVGLNATLGLVGCSAAGFKAAHFHGRAHGGRLAACKRNRSIAAAHLQRCCASRVRGHWRTVALPTAALPRCARRASQPAGSGMGMLAQHCSHG
jgi:hypothetical protein